MECLANCGTSRFAQKAPYPVLRAENTQSSAKRIAKPMALNASTLRCSLTFRSRFIPKCLQVKTLRHLALL